MIQIIISIDPSTDFLYGIVENFKNKNINYNLTEIHPNEESYESAFEFISNVTKKTVIIFLGHGQPNLLYGGESSEHFPKRAFVKLNEMAIFEGQYLFLLACNSASLIRSSFKQSKTINSIGFGALPTSLEEVENNRRLESEKISKATIEDFKQEIVITVSDAIIRYHNDFNRLSDYLALLLDQRINNAVLVKKDRLLADLLFHMRKELIIF
ncbi:hypothetical protein BWD42_02385 [Sphingobacterium sp. CZ-UAM]|uniref:hypothetical protein n=1 Tax=Sphingobacterium sp. CZ-UAM TaxID=1933868 RepID=UPI0009863952|nr:hypothetical protein [Sphingobacterium sp. CZ-UAM]OOG18828.1 hypothetical protein BWD42_02385 [Sphingobacterium sp. CZ-UAM]